MSIYKKWIKNFSYITIGAFLILILDISCVVRNATGFPCPSCGITRAYLALFKADFSMAFFMHPLFWILPIILILYIIKPNFFSNKSKQCRFLLTLVIALFLVVYIIRMILFFPHTEPMNYNHDAYVNLLFEKINIAIYI